MDADAFLYHNNPPGIIDDRIIVGLPPPECVKKATRNHWRPLELSTEENGIAKYTYPFLKDPRVMLLISYFCMYNPLYNHSEKLVQHGPNV
jgi:hypothetical protein